MPQNNEKLLEKLKKLLALAKSDNPHEAALALQRAQKLMQAYNIYNITQADLALSDIDESVSNYWAAGSVNPPRYMLGLLDIIQVAFGVKSIIHSGFKPSVGFYGNKDRVELASYTWEVLARQLIVARKNYIRQQNKRIKNRPRPVVVTSLQKDGFWPCAARFIYLLCPAKNGSWQASGLNKNTLTQAQPRAVGPGNHVTRTCPATSVTEKGKTSACISLSAGRNSGSWGVAYDG